MARFLRISLWNANGLGHHIQEIASFLINHKIDIMIISETHFTRKSFIKIPKYKIYDTKHPDGTAHGGTAIIVKETLRHYELEKYQKDFLQATNIMIEEPHRKIAISAIYCPPKHTIKKEQFEAFYSTLGPRFIEGGDYNAKHPAWGSRLTTTKGRELYKAIAANGLTTLSTGEPTYWPTDRNKTPDVIDFLVVKGISSRFLEAKSCLDLSSDHSPIIVNYSSHILEQIPPPALYNSKTKWNLFRELINSRLTCNIPLKSETELNQGVETFTTIIQDAAKEATPINKKNVTNENLPLIIKQKIAEKRRLRRVWQNRRHPSDKTNLNRASRELKHRLSEIQNQSLQNFLQSLTATESTNYSLWRATKKLKRPQTHIPPIRTQNGNWARDNSEKATAFADHYENVFKPFPPNITSEEENYLHELQNTPSTSNHPIKPIKVAEIKAIVHNLNPNKAPGADKITSRILKELPAKGIRFLTIIYNAIIRLKVFPKQWKIAEIITVPKPGKDPKELTSYRPISLLPAISKIFEKLLLQRLQPLFEEKNLIPRHQFGFRQQHGTTEQIHRITNKINQALQTKRYCSAVFLDISQAFDKVWHAGLLIKLRKELPYDAFKILESYITNRMFSVKYQCAHSSFRPISSGVPQGSVLGPALYLLYTADLPAMRQTMVATFADDTAILALHRDPAVASNILQENLNKIQKWLRTWRIKANESKSVHVTFTLNKATCPPVKLNNQQIPQADTAKYLGIHLDRRLTFKTHIQKKRLHLEEKRRQMYWLLGWKSQLSVENKLLLYKAVIKPIWTYGIQLWGSASNSNIEILQRFQNKALKQIVNAPRYVPNWLVHQDLNMPTIKDEIKRFSKKYQSRLANHPNKLAANLLHDTTVRRLKRTTPLDCLK